MALSISSLDSIPGVCHGFGTRLEPLPEIFRDLWDERHMSWKQVHGTSVVEVRSPRQDCGEADAFFTRQPGIPLAVITADCVPILLARKAGGAVAAVHAGWRGTQARALRTLWEKLRSLGEDPADWVAGVGPAIGPCCYEVSPDLAEEFRLEFQSFGEGLAVPYPRRLDLPSINEAELKDIGLGGVEVLRACTRCSGTGEGPQFFSYRRNGFKNWQWSVIASEY
jgi:YfiH family protein